MRELRKKPFTSKYLSLRLGDVRQIADIRAFILSNVIHTKRGFG